MLSRTILLLQVLAAATSFVVSSPVNVVESLVNSMISEVTASPSMSIGSIASTFAGATTADVFPPPNATPNTIAFPNAIQVGFPGPTATGIEPFVAAQTNLPFPVHTDIYPLVVPKPYSTTSSAISIPSILPNPIGSLPVSLLAITNEQETDSPDTEPFVMQRNWGDYCPAYSVNSSVYGLNNASPIAPAMCEVIQVHYWYRHGARYPTSGENVAIFAAKVHKVASSTGFNSTGPLSFLSTWEYKLGVELLVHFGRKQNFDLGISARFLYGHLLNAFTSLPVFRTESNARMVQTAQNFAAGFFGIPNNDQFNLLFMIENDGFNNTGAPYDTCPNANLPVAEQGSVAGVAYANLVFVETVARLNSFVPGLNLTAGTDVVAMMAMCSYETVAIGSSPFCDLFTEQEWYDSQYINDLGYYYDWSFGSPTAAAQGLGFLQEFVARLTKTPITIYNSTTNSTLDGNNITFPLDQPIYADASHEVVILALMTALNLTSLAASGPLPLTSRPKNQTFVSSRIVPFATSLVSQVLQCGATKMIRFMVNDAVVPLSYSGCQYNVDGMCEFDTVVSALHQRVSDIDFEYACYGNYTASVGVDLNGLPPAR